MTEKKGVGRRKISLAHANFPDISPPRMVELAAEAGYDAIGLRLEPANAEDSRHPMLGKSSMLAETRSRLRDTGLTVLDIEVFRLESGRDFARYEPVLEVCSEIGAANLLLTCSIPDATERIESLGRACLVAKQYGLNLALEFKPWDVVSTAALAMEMIAGVGASNAKVLVDTLHVHRGGIDLSQLDALPASVIDYVQICDAAGERSTTADIIREARHARLSPGDGEISIDEILSHLPQVPLSVEIQNDDRRRELGEFEMARLGLEDTKRLLGNHVCV